MSGGTKYHESLLERESSRSAQYRDVVVGPESSWLGLQLNHASKAFPRPWLWLLVALVAFVWRRPRNWRVPTVLAASALIVLFATVLGVYAIPEYSVPVAPSFLLLAAVALFGTRSPA